jgi:hypothetical protein
MSCIAWYSRQVSKINTLAGSSNQAPLRAATWQLRWAAAIRSAGEIIGKKTFLIGSIFKNHLHSVIRELTNTEVCPHCHIPAPNSWWRDKQGWWVESSTCSAGSCFSFLNMLVMGDQAWLSVKPPPLLKLFLLRYISIASFTR